MCSDSCQCINLFPKPRCIARMSGTFSCLRDEGSIELSTLVKDLSGDQDEVTSENLREIRVEERPVLNEQQISPEQDEDFTYQRDLDFVDDRGWEPHVDTCCLDTTDRGPSESRLQRRASSLTDHKPRDIKAQNATQVFRSDEKEERQHLGPFNLASTAPTTQATAKSTTTSQSGQDTNCTDPRYCIERPAQSKSKTRSLSIGEADSEPEPEPNTYINNTVPSVEPQNPHPNIGKGGGGGGGGAGAGAAAAAAAANAGHSRHSAAATLQNSGWLCFKTFVGVMVSFLVWGS